MKHRDHVRLIAGGIPAGGTWADLGSGDGAFTLALAELLGPSGVIYSVDKKSRALRNQRRKVTRDFPRAAVQYHQADFREDLAFLPPLDGILMANSLHFVRDKETAVRRIRRYLKPNGRFLLVEYNTDRGNYWVPYPLSFRRWQKLADLVGFSHTELLGAHPSSFLGEFYAALSA